MQWPHWRKKKIKLISFPIIRYTTGKKISVTTSVSSQLVTRPFMAFFTYENGTDNCFRLAHLSGVGSEMVKRLKNATETLLNVFQKWLVTVIRKARGQQERKCEIKIEESNAMQKSFLEPSSNLTYSTTITTKNNYFHHFRWQEIGRLGYLRMNCNM